MKKIIQIRFYTMNCQIFLMFRLIFSEVFSCLLLHTEIYCRLFNQTENSKFFQSRIGFNTVNLL